MEDPDAGIGRTILMFDCLSFIIEIDNLSRTCDHVGIVHAMLYFLGSD